MSTASSLKKESREEGDKANSDLDSLESDYDDGLDSDDIMGYIN